MSDFVNTRTSKGDQATLDALIANTLTELKEDGVRKIGTKALYSNQGLTSVEFPNVTDVGASGISVCPKLQSVKLAACISIGANAFERDVLLEEFEATEYDLSFSQSKPMYWCNCTQSTMNATDKCNHETIQNYIKVLNWVRDGQIDENTNKIRVYGAKFAELLPKLIF